VTADEETNLQGYLAIDATVSGRSYGGVRMAADLSPDSLEYKERLYDMFYKKCPGCSSHHNMNLLYHAPWIKDEILWTIRMKKRHVLRFLGGGVKDS